MSIEYPFDLSVLACIGSNVLWVVALQCVAGPDIMASRPEFAGKVSANKPAATCNQYCAHALYLPFNESLPPPFAALLLV